MSELRILLVDGSAMRREAVSSYLMSQSDLAIAGSSPSLKSARQRAGVVAADVLLLGDVDDAAGEELHTIAQDLQLAACALPPVEEGSEAAFVAVADAVRAAGQRARDRCARRKTEPTPATKPQLSTAQPGARRVAGPPLFGRSLIAIGASAGGAELLGQVLPLLEPPLPPIVLVVHMPGAFTGRFAQRLDNECMVDVLEAQQGIELPDSTVTIAPGGWHMSVQVTGGRYSVLLDQEPEVKRHRPSVDVLFDSVADCVGEHALGIILTGMGADGADGLWMMRQSGAHTVAQDQASCAVYGMPRAASERGAVAEFVSGGDVHMLIHHWASKFQGSKR